MTKAPTRRKLFDLHGEARINPDGRSRQDELLICRPGEAVQLRRDPAEPDAFLIVSERGEPIGNLSRQDSALLGPAIDRGRRHQARLHSILGGLPRYPRYGARISIAWDGGRQLAHRPLDSAQLAERERRRSTPTGRQGLLRRLSELAFGPPP